MKKNDVVKSNILFNEIINKGKYIKNRYYVIYYMDKEDVKSKFGIAVGKKVGNAVTRNKIKRQIRCIIDKNRKSFPNNHNYVILCKRDVLKLNFQDMEKYLIELVERALYEK